MCIPFFVRASGWDYRCGFRLGPHHITEAGGLYIHVDVSEKSNMNLTGQTKSMLINPEHVLHGDTLRLEFLLTKLLFTGWFSLLAPCCVKSRDCWLWKSQMTIIFWNIQTSLHGTKNHVTVKFTVISDIRLLKKVTELAWGCIAVVSCSCVWLISSRVQFKQKFLWEFFLLNTVKADLPLQCLRKQILLRKSSHILIPNRLPFSPCLSSIIINLYLQLWALAGWMLLHIKWLIDCV